METTGEQADVKWKGYASLTNDYMFKRIFGSEECKDILITFLNRIVGNGEIEDVTFLNTEHLGQTAEDRKSVFDISVRTQTGNEYIIEMQLARQKYFRDRALFYTSYPINNQAARAKQEYIDRHGDSAGFRWDFRLKPVRFIAVVDFEMKHCEGWNAERYHSSYRLREDESGELLHDKLQFIFLELARFNKKEDELEGYYDKWMYLFKNMANLKERPEVFKEKEFDRLFSMAEICNFTPKEYYNYQEANRMIYDYENTIDYARMEGELKRAAEVAKSLVEMGLPIEQIAEATKLTVEEVSRLHSEPEEINKYLKTHKMPYDYKSIIDYIRNKEERQAELAEGELKGRDAERIEVARNLVEMGLSVKQIAEATKLTEEEIIKLSK